MLIHAPTVIVLASGKGERFTASGGQVHKLQALLNRKKVIDWTLDAVRASGLPFYVEDAGHPGIGDSIAAAVRATRDAHGWLILLADLPFIQPATLLAVAQALQSADHVIPTFNGQRGHPVGVSTRHITELLNCKGNKGFAQVNADDSAIKLVVNDRGCVADIDTVEDLEKARNWLAGV
jgi:molybdenum cofactor cytidylyltransferase